MTLCTLTYACGCQSVGMFTTDAAGLTAQAYARTADCRLCAASHTYRDAMAHRELAERATREVLAAREQEQVNEHL